MKQSTRNIISPEKLHCILAMQFRSTRDQTTRTEIAKAYSRAINRLIKSGKWRDIPPLEDQLPDDWMPAAFFDYWSLSPPTRQSGRKKRGIRRNQSRVDKQQGEVWLSPLERRKGNPENVQSVTTIAEWIPHGRPGTLPARPVDICSGSRIRWQMRKKIAR